MSNSGGQSTVPTTARLVQPMMTQAIQQQQQQHLVQQSMQPPPGPTLTTQIPVNSQQQVASTGFFQVTMSFWYLVHDFFAFAL